MSGRQPCPNPKWVTGARWRTTVLLLGENDWGRKKSARRRNVAKDYRILALIGDNPGDFTDQSGGAPADRAKVYEKTHGALGHLLDHKFQSDVRILGSRGVQGQRETGQQYPPSNEAGRDDLLARPELV